MTRFEYKVIPAPSRGQRGKGVKGADGKFANALEQLMNQMGTEGWEYQRAETLPSEERSGLASKSTVFRNVLVFRRALETDIDAFEPKLLDPPSKPDEEDRADDAAENQEENVTDHEKNDDQHESEQTPHDASDDSHSLRMRAQQLSQSD